MKKHEILFYVDNGKRKFYCFRKRIKKNGKICIKSKYLSPKELNMYKSKYSQLSLVNDKKITFKEYLELTLFGR